MIPRSVRLAVVALLLWLLPATAFAEPVATDVLELISARPPADGSQVRFRGEAIGDVFRAEDGRSWVNVFDGGAAMGVWAETESTNQLRTLGDYNARGEQVEVVGTFNQTCEVHGGDRDVHAASLTIVGPAVPTPHPVQPMKAVVGVAGFALAGLLYWLYRRRVEATPL